FLSLAALCLLWGVGRGAWGVGAKAPGANDSLPPPTPYSPLPTILLVFAARAALLPIRVDQDPWQIFRFDLFASRMLGPFSRSPFDLLASAAAILAIVLALTKVRG